MRIVTLVLLASFALGACNTMRGLGEDVRQLGESITRSASKK